MLPYALDYVCNLCLDVSMTRRKPQPIRQNKGAPLGDSLRILASLIAQHHLRKLHLEQVLLEEAAAENPDPAPGADEESGHD